MKSTPKMELEILTVKMHSLCRGIGTKYVCGAARKTPRSDPGRAATGRFVERLSESHTLELLFHRAVEPEQECTGGDRASANLRGRRRRGAHRSAKDAT